MEDEQQLGLSRSAGDTMHAKIVPDPLDTGKRTLAYPGKVWILRAPFIKPTILRSSSPEAGPENEERINYQNHMARPSIDQSVAPPRFINPAKILKPNKEERCFGSYLNQHQLHKLRRKETQVVEKLESKSILELQTLQHKALTIHASNKMKNLVQDALFKKHMAEMEEWESQLDVWSKT